jgi:putative spermidine/putrescine transport system ATP-binding protein
VLRSSRPLPPSGDLVLAVQSEKLLIDDGAGDGTHNRLRGRVADIVYQGESLRVFVTLEDGSSLSLRQPSHFVAARQIPPVGEPLNLRLHPEDTIIVPRADD